MKEIVKKIGSKKAAIIGTVIILFLVLLSLVGPSLNEYEYDAVNVVDQHQGADQQEQFEFSLSAADDR